MAGFFVVTKCIDLLLDKVLEHKPDWLEMFAYVKANTLQAIIDVHARKPVKAIWDGMLTVLEGIDPNALLLIA